MAIDWVNGFITPIVKLVFIGGFVIFISYFVIKAFWKLWINKIQWILKYSIFRNEYPEKIVRFCMDSIEKNKAAYEVKKEMLIENKPYFEIYETMFIYHKLYNELKGGEK